jgi:precorrin-2/cobalt-factor-2 C20-methyltransferase
MRAERFPAREIYDSAARQIGGHLAEGRDVVALCEGDPFFYGSFMYLFERITSRYPVEIVPGVSSLTAAAAALARPLAGRNDVLTVIPAPLDDDRIRDLLAGSEAAAILKVGRHFARIRALLAAMGLLEMAMLAERVGLPDQRLSRLADLRGEGVPYFSVILVYKGAEVWIGKLPLIAGASA